MALPWPAKNGNADTLRPWFYACCCAMRAMPLPRSVSVSAGTAVGQSATAGRHRGKGWYRSRLFRGARAKSSEGLLPAHRCAPKVWWLRRSKTPLTSRDLHSIRYRRIVVTENFPVPPTATFNHYYPPKSIQRRTDLPQPRGRMSHWMDAAKPEPTASASDSTRCGLPVVSRSLPNFARSRRDAPMARYCSGCRCPGPWRRCWRVPATFLRLGYDSSSDPLCCCSAKPIRRSFQEAFAGMTFEAATPPAHLAQHD